MRKIGLIFIFGVLMIFTTNLFAGGIKIGIFDLQEVMIKSDAGKDIKSLLQQKKEYYTQEIKKREQALKKMRDEIEKKSMMLSDSAREEKEKEYQRKLRDLKLYASDSENELKNIYREKTQKLIHDIVIVVKDFAKKNNFTFVIEKQEGGVVYASEAVDITKDILKEFNNYYHSKKK